VPENGDNLPFIFRHFGKISFLLALLYVLGLMLDELCPKSTAAFVYRDVGFTVFVIFAVLVAGGWVLAIPFLALTARKKADEILLLILISLIFFPISMFAFSFVLMSFLYVPLVYTGYREFELWLFLGSIGTVLASVYFLYSQIRQHPLFIRFLSG
jgi:hypothetical protein